MSANGAMTVGDAREILAHYPASAKIMVDIDHDLVNLKPDHSTHGGVDSNDEVTAVVFWAHTQYKMMLLSQDEQAAVEKMREDA